MSERQALIPLETIQRVQVYINSPRKSLAAIKKATGADYIINGTIYNMTTGAVNCHLKADGKIIAKPGYTVYGLSWDTGKDMRMEVLPNERRNYIACTPLILNGKPLTKLTYAAGMGGSRPRSAIGLHGDKLSLYCTTSGKTPERLRDDLVKKGWTQAVMLDGGGSTQCDFAGQKITSSRKVQHLILVYLEQEPEEPKGEKPMVEINAYSKKKDGSKKLSANFTVKEFACSDGSDAVLVAPRLVMVLQSIRSHFGKAVTINSGYRTPQKNTSVGGAAQSQHCYGTAADIVVKGIAPAKVAAYAREIMPDWGGVGIYERQGFTHVDVREVKSDWKGT